MCAKSWSKQSKDKRRVLSKKAVVNRTAGVSWRSQVEVFRTALSEELGEVSWKVGVINGSLVGCVCVM